MPIDLFRCPDHPEAGPLVPVAAGGACPACRREFRAQDGVFDLLSAESVYPDDFREREMAQWDEQADSYERGRTDDRVYMECVNAAAEALAPEPGELVLDAGCGTGLTLRSYWRPGVEAVALDLSAASLRRCRAAGPKAGAVYVRGDLARLPFADGTFDRVVCPNVLQQIPSADLRRQCARELARVTKPGGRVVFTVHNYSWQRQRAGWVKENSAKGPSGDVQYIYRHEPDEFRELVSEALTPERVCGAGFPLWYRWKLSPVSRLVERVLRRIPAFAPFGHMLVAVCRRPG